MADHHERQVGSEPDGQDDDAGQKPDQQHYQLDVVEAVTIHASVGRWMTEPSLGVLATAGTVSVMAVDQRTTAETPVDPLVAACGLVSRLDEGSPLPVIGDPLGVDAEALHAVVWVNACWFGPAEVVYDDPLYLDFSSWPRLAGTGAASVLGHHRRQAAGAALAAPQWRALGEKPVRALLTE
ncbi:MAG TPA: hypothetical protein VIL36_21140, partial [Acidimicrobiales bacterium]